MLTVQHLRKLPESVVVFLPVLHPPYITHICMWSIIVVSTSYLTFAIIIGTSDNIVIIWSFYPVITFFFEFQ